MEGIVNALIHRSYIELGSEVHIDMFDDRLEIYSPGSNFCGVEITKDNMLYLPSKRRNPILADIFARLKYMERRGSGLKKIVGDYEIQPNFSENLRPFVLSLGEDFTLILKNLNYMDDTQNDIQDDTQDDTQKSIDNKILQMIKENKNVTTEQIAETLNTSIITIKRHIKNIKQVKYVGSGYSGHWEILK